MFTHPSALQHMVPGEPTAAALHREEFFNEKSESAETTEDIPDHRLSHKVAILRAQVVESVGRHFS